MRDCSMSEFKWIDEQGEPHHEVVRGIAHNYISVYNEAAKDKDKEHADDPIYVHEWVFTPHGGLFDRTVFHGEGYHDKCDDDCYQPPKYIDAEYTVVDSKPIPLEPTPTPEHKWWHGLERQRAQHVPNTRPNKHHNRTRRLM